MSEKKLKPILWAGSSKTDLKKMPKAVITDFGYALYEAQQGEFPSIALAMKGFSGANVIELKLPHKGNAYRAVYTVKFSKALVVLHTFQKKSTKGIATPKKEIDLIKARLKVAEDLYERWQKEDK